MEKGMDLIYPAIFGALKGLCTGIAVSFEGTVSVLMHFFSMETPEAGMYSALACAGIALGLAARYIIRLARGVSGTAVMLFRMARKGFNYREESTPAQRDSVMFLISALPALIPLALVGRWPVTASDTDMIAEGACFLISGALLHAAARSPLGTDADGTMRAGHALIIGLAAVTGIFPGISGTAAALSAALLLGYDPSYSVRFALSASLPAALTLSLTDAGLFAAAEGELPGIWETVICAAAAAAAVYAVSWLLQLLAKKEKLSFISYLMMIAGLGIIILGAAETIAGVPVAELIAELKGKI